MNSLMLPERDERAKSPSDNLDGNMIENGFFSLAPDEELAKCIMRLTWPWATFFNLIAVFWLPKKFTNQTETRNVDLAQAVRDHKLGSRFAGEKASQHFHPVTFCLINQFEFEQSKRKYLLVERDFSCFRIRKRTQKKLFEAYCWASPAGRCWWLNWCSCRCSSCSDGSNFSRTQQYKHDRSNASKGTAEHGNGNPEFFPSNLLWECCVWVANCLLKAC